MKLIDAHTHLDYITSNAQSVVCCSTQESDWIKIIDLMKVNSHVYGAFGIHPWFVNTVSLDWEKRLSQLLEHNSNYMVGEIGLDKYKPDMEKQIEVFGKQFDIAVKLNRNIFLHCVGAWDKILYALKLYKNLPKIVIHDFNANTEITQKLLYYNSIMFSFGKNVLYDRNCHIEQIPLHKILVETDAKNDVELSDILDKISKIKNEQDISNIVYNNAKRILKNG